MPLIHVGQRAWGKRWQGIVMNSPWLNLSIAEDVPELEKVPPLDVMHHRLYGRGSGRRIKFRTVQEQLTIVLPCGLSIPKQQCKLSLRYSWLRCLSLTGQGLKCWLPRTTSIFHPAHQLRILFNSPAQIALGSSVSDHLTHY